MMTPWTDIAINVVQLLPLFQNIPDPDPHPTSGEDEDHTGSGKRSALKGAQHRTAEEMPNGQFASISYVRVYANCRIRRIWLVSLSCHTALKVELTE